MADVDLYIDVPRKRLVSGFNNAKYPSRSFGGSALRFLSRDSVNLRLHLLTDNTFGRTLFRPLTQAELDGMSGIPRRIQIGMASGMPEAGNGKLISLAPAGEAGLPTNPTAADMQSALAELGHDTTVEVPEGRAGYYVVTWNAPGAQVLLDLDTNGYVPTTDYSVSRLVEGDIISSTVNEVQIIQIRTSAFAEVDTDGLVVTMNDTATDDSTALGASSWLTRANVDVVDGPISITVTVTEGSATTSMDANASESLVLERINAALGSLETETRATSVTAFGFGKWIINFSGAVTSVELGVTPNTIIDTPVEYSNPLNLNTDTMGLVMDGRTSSLSIPLEIEFPNGDTALRDEVTLVPDVARPAPPITPAPVSNYYTKGEVDAELLGLFDNKSTLDNIVAEAGKTHIYFSKQGTYERLPLRVVGQESDVAFLVDVQDGDTVLVWGSQTIKRRVSGAWVDVVFGPTTPSVREVTSNSTFLSDDDILYATDGNLFTLPAATASSKPLTLKNRTGGDITLQANGTDEIDGSASLTLSPNDALTCISTGSNWIII